MYDYQLSYDLLPPITRWIVRPIFSRIYPRLHHANVEIRYAVTLYAGAINPPRFAAYIPFFALRRTAYLDKAVSSIISSICHQQHNTTATEETSSIQSPINIRLIVMGGGYDTRSFKFIEHHFMHNSNPPERLRHKRRKRRGWRFFSRKTQPNPMEKLPNSTQYSLKCYELDLPEVVGTKRKLIDSRLSRRRPWLKFNNDGMLSNKNPTLLEVDLNNVNQTRGVLESIVSDADDGPTANIVLFEGVMIYLDEGIPHALLDMCSDVFRKHRCSDRAASSSALNYLCFADRLDNIPGGDEDLAQIEMESTGWALEDWLSKPGLARHMGFASLARETPF